MQETQQTVHQWINGTFPGTDPDSPRKAIRALEEMVELCIASGADFQDMFTAVRDGYNSAHDHPKSPNVRSFDPDKIASEAADVLIVLYGVAGMRGFDLHAEVDRKMAVNRARRWQANGDGTGYHIKENAS